MIAAPSRRTDTTRAEEVSIVTTRCPIKCFGISRSTSTTDALGSVHSTAGSSGRIRRKMRSDVHFTVATVAMPSRS